MPTQQDHGVENTLFRAAVAKRLGGHVTPKDEGTPPVCHLVGREGRCGTALDPERVHQNQCKCGGFISRRHDRISKFLHGWLQDGRSDSDVLLEQLVAGADQGEGDRLDVTFESGGRRIWLDVAVVTTYTTSRRDRARRAKVPGAAARAEEAHKRSRYRGLATPFVIEAGGRPGDSARTIIAKYAVDKGDGESMDVASAWQSLSAIIQADTADVELRACGWGPAQRADAPLVIP